MTSSVSRWSNLHFVVGLAITVGLAIGVGGAGCAVAPDEPAASENDAPALEATAQASTAAGTAGFQIVWQCFTPGGATVGLPKSPLSACQAACSPPNFCMRCVWRNHALECD